MADATCLGMNAGSVATRIGQESKASAQNSRNQTVWFGKPDGLVLSIPTAVRGAVDT
jgi:hypothetical protein